MKRIITLIAMALAAGLLLSSCGTQRQAVAGSGSSDEEQLNIGYGTIDKSANGGSVDQVNIKDAESYTDIYSYLRSKVPGVQVRGTQIMVRGVSSVNSGTDPLILVDGSEVNDISTIRPAEVKSVTVLKGSSASIYGIRGANGVILITLIKAGDQ